MVLKQAASGVPVVFLTPTLSRPGDWEPFLVGFAGLKLLHPWQSMPIILRAPDDDWQQVADELIPAGTDDPARHIGHEQRTANRGRDDR
jgi:hypothetical protein